MYSDTVYTLLSLTTTIVTIQLVLNVYQPQYKKKTETSQRTDEFKRSCFSSSYVYVECMGGGKSVCRLGLGGVNIIYYQNYFTWKLTRWKKKLFRYQELSVLIKLEMINYIDWRLYISSGWLLSTFLSHPQYALFQATFQDILHSWQYFT